MEVSDGELDSRPCKKIAAGKGARTPKAAARAPTTPARTCQRGRETRDSQAELESIAKEFLQDDGPRVSPCKSLSVVSRLCYAYIEIIVPIFVFWDYPAYYSYT